jgi:hypothetical protein
MVEDGEKGNELGVYLTLETGLRILPMTPDLSN